MNWASPFLYPILDLEYTTDPIRDAEILIQAGVQLIQLRAKKATRRAAYEVAQSVSALCKRSDVCFLMNDLVDVALVLDDCGVHLGQDDFPVRPARALIPHRIIGFSTHNRQQFDLAGDLPVDYVAIGPVFESRTKPAENPPLGLDEVAGIVAEKKKPVVAIGGIRLSNVKDLIKIGVDGIAVISQLYQDGRLSENTLRFMDEMKSS